MRTGARRFDRSFLCTHRKFTSLAVMVLPFTLIVTGIAEMKATSFLEPTVRTPRCQHFFQWGAIRAHVRVVVL